MGIECLDLIFLHTYSAEVLRAGEAADALMRARDAGKCATRGYSGDDSDALQAISMGVFYAIQVTFNILNQTALDEVLPAAQRAGIGVVAKLPSPTPGCCHPTHPSSTAAPTGLRFAPC